MIPLISYRSNNNLNWQKNTKIITIIKTHEQIHKNNHGLPSTEPKLKILPLLQVTQTKVYGR